MVLNSTKENQSMKARFTLIPIACMGMLIFGQTLRAETVILQEDFEAYTSTAELAAVWNAGSNNPFYALDTTVGNTGNSYKFNPPPSNFQGRLARNLPGGPIQATNENPIEVTVDMLLDEAGAEVFWSNARHYVELRGYSGGSFASGDLENLIALGVNNFSNNLFNTTFYHGRVTFGANWVTLNEEEGAVQRQTGWQTLSVRITGDEVRFSVNGTLCLVTARPNNFLFDSFVLGSDLTAFEHTAWIDNVKVAILDSVPATSVERAFVYHNSWSGAGSAIDSVKSLHKEGDTPQELTFDNLINTATGINGVGFDIQGLADPGALTEADFEFQVSPQGAFSQGDNPPSGWAAAPVPSSVTATPGSPDQVLIVWPDNSIENRWLRVVVKATANTGLAADEVYYLGHLLGETTGAVSGIYTIAFADVTEIRAGSGQTVDSSSPLDIDKNGTVSFADIAAMRANVSGQLTNITVP
jgi:hypothetical protein